MYSYVTKELPALTETILPQLDHSRRSIMGHSMGGHGSLVISLRNPSMFKSVSAFSPIVNPSVVPWGQKAFGEYLASKTEWAEYDATELAREASPDTFKAPILIDQGSDDEFLDVQLK